jgi:hypothetical protein
VPWQPPTLLSLLARTQFAELSQLLHVLHRCRPLRAREAADNHASEQTGRDVLASLAAPATTHLARDVDRLDDAIAYMRGDATLDPLFP